MTNNPAITERADTDDFLHGGAAIGAHLRSKGLNVTDTDVYYLARTKKIAVGKWGKHLIASKRRLDRDLKRTAQALTT
jgi:hypothetical protein